MAITVELPSKIPQEDLALLIVQTRRLDIRDVDNGQEPFLYSSGNYGPGYLDIKGACGIDEVFEPLCQQSALALMEQDAKFDFIAGNATGGMIPAFRVKQLLADWTGRRIPYAYLRNTRKLGGHGEYTTGIANNPYITKESRPLIYEELVNYAETTGNAATVWRETEHHEPAMFAGTIVEYANPEARKRLQEQSLTLVSVIDLPTILNIAEDLNLFPRPAINGFREFLASPFAWMNARGIQKKELS